MNDPALPATESAPPPEAREGIHFAYLLDGRGGSSPLDPDGVRAWKPGDGILWVLLDRFSDRAPAWLGETLGLPEVACDGLLEENTRPRLSRIGDGLLIILRGVNVNPGAEPDDMVSVRLWVDEGRVICLRGPRVYALSDLRERLAAGSGARTVGEVVVQLAEALVDRIRDVVANQQDLVDEIDEASMESSSPELRRRLRTPRRQAMTIRRYLAPQRDMVARLVSEPSALFGDRDRVRLRETADELTRQVEELDLLRERASLIQEQMAATASEQMNRTMYVLSLVAAIFLPLGLITGLLGINVGGMPGEGDARAFWIVCGLLVVLASLQYLWFRWHRWM